MILEWIGQITERANIITLAIAIAIAIAIAGAGFAALGADAVASRLGIGPKVARWLLRCGYTAMWTSVALFIVARFLPRG